MRQLKRGEVHALGGAVAVGVRVGQFMLDPLADHVRMAVQVDTGLGAPSGPETVEEDLPELGHDGLGHGPEQCRVGGNEAPAKDLAAFVGEERLDTGLVLGDPFGVAGGDEGDAR